MKDKGFFGTLNVSIISSIILILCGTIVNYIIDKIGINNIGLIVTLILLLLTNSYILLDYEINHNKKFNLNKISFIVTASFLNFKISYLFTPILAEKCNSYYLQLLVLGTPTGLTKEVYRGAIFFLIAIVIFIIGLVLLQVISYLLEKNQFVINNKKKVEEEKRRRRIRRRRKIRKHI